MRLLTRFYQRLVHQFLDYGYACSLPGPLSHALLRLFTRTLVTSPQTVTARNHIGKAIRFVMTRTTFPSATMMAGIVAVTL